MTSARENKSFMIHQTDGYLWFQVQLRGILCICGKQHFQGVYFQPQFDIRSLEPQSGGPHLVHHNREVKVFA